MLRFVDDSAVSFQLKYSLGKTLNRPDGKDHSDFQVAFIPYTANTKVLYHVCFHNIPNWE